tara:strand:- start:296 stop:538 length:243 start_codon:yes stop_codon:yes gene_type:complete
VLQDAGGKLKDCFSVTNTDGKPSVFYFYLSVERINDGLTAQEPLSVGGFDTIDGEPAFVIVNQDGQRVGTLGMTTPGVQE